ncbi:MAG: NADH-quinone oxidoreductase subunit L, partial [Planctomycetales bacterium]|nr:NADH-quinone oxidoreductase subunit L [Planctomycetales bacterium]
MFDAATLIKLIVALPLLSAVATAILGPRVLRHQSHWLTIGALATSCCLSLLLGWNVSRAINTNAQPGESADVAAHVGYEQIVPIWTWAEVNSAYEPSSTSAVDGTPVLADTDARDFSIGVTLRVDPLTAMMLMMVTFVATLVAIYAQGYMHDDRGYWRFFAYVSLFVFSMTMLVSVSNFLLLYVFWEAVGLCSYLLIGFWYEKPEAAAAGKKAFLVNRVGDFGFALALFFIWTTYGTLNFHDSPDVAGVLGQLRLTGQLGYVAGGTGLAICLLLLVGACGKSAQFPLHVWLPDAMEGPTPVSALVHSATMVAAGVFLVGRFYPAFCPEVLFVIAIVGCITLFMAATIAITATDIKRVLAYSTVSQLGYMMLALGVGGWLAGVLHLFTHAFFKSLLFMCSGSVIHAVHTNEMPLMGGLRRKMPYTAYTMLIGCLAIAGAGIPFVIGFSGYYSKDAILEQALLFKNTNPTWGSIFFFAAAGGASITAFYMFRLWYMTFAGQPRDAERYDHAHESPPVMYVPLVVLSVFAVGAAWGMNSIFGGLSDALIGGAIALAIFLGLWYLINKERASDAVMHGAGHASHSGHGDHSHGDHSHGDHSHGHQHGPSGNWAVPLGI